MNTVSEVALLGEVNKLKSAHNNLATKAGADLTQMAAAIRQIAGVVTELQGRVATLESALRQRTMRPAQQVRQPPGQPQTQQQPVPQTQPQVQAQTQPVDKPAINLTAATTPDPMTAGWADDDEEDADYEDA